MGTLLSLFWIKLKITFKFILPLILREQRHTHCNFIFLLSSMWRNWLRRPCIHRHRDRYSSINLSLIFQIRNKIQIFIPKTPSMLPPPTPLAPGHPADTPFFLLVSCWPFQDHKSTWADFAWATFPLFPWFVEVCGARSCTQDGWSAWSRERQLWNWVQKGADCMLTTMLKREGQFWQEMLQGWSDSLVWGGWAGRQEEKMKFPERLHRDHALLLSMAEMWLGSASNTGRDGAWGWVEGFGCFSRLLWVGVWKPGHHAVLLYSEDVIRQFCMNLNMNLGGSSACRASKPFETGKMVTWNAELPRVSETCWLNCIWLWEKHVSK